jgi:hypothetical protein
MPTIHPVLHRPSAFDLDKFASRYLANCEVDVPVVSYLRVDDEGNSAYISWRAVEKKKGGLEELDARARKSLGERPDRPGWTPINIFHRGKEVTIMIRLGDFFTASDVMDPELLEIPKNYFKSDTVFVGIPHACYMLASTSPEFLFNDFHSAYDEAVAEGVQFLEQVFRIDNGEITEIIETMPIGPAPTLKMIKKQGVLWFVVPYRGNFQHLEYMIRNDLRTYLPQYCNDAHFGGRVVFEIPPEAASFTSDQVRDLGKFEAMLNAIAQEEQWNTLLGQAAVIRIRFSQRSKTVQGLDSSALQGLKDSAREYDEKQQSKRAKRPRRR